MPIWKKMRMTKQTQGASSARSLLRYMFNEHGAELIITRNLVGNTIKEWEDQYRHLFNKWSTKTRKSRSVVHEAISWSKAEDRRVLTREMLVDIAKKAIELRGDEGLYVVVADHSKDLCHLHFFITTTSIISNKELRLEGGNFKQIRIDLEQYIREHYPEIKHSFVYDLEREKEKRMVMTDGDYRTQKNNRHHRKSHAHLLVKEAMENSNTMSELQDNLTRQGLGLLERNTKITGVRYRYKNNNAEVKEMKIRFTTLGLQKDFEAFLERSNQLQGMQREKGEGQAKQQKIEHEWT